MNDRINDDKKALRAVMKRRQQSLPEAYTAPAGDCIQTLFLSSPLYTAAQSIFLYLSMPGEVSTGRILNQALADGKRIYVPKCIGDKMLAVPYRGPDALHPGLFGIPEPMNCAGAVQAKHLDLVIVPCLAASLDGRRLGHGKGYYDRFLQEKSSHAVCLCFKKMLCPDIPMDDNDVYIPFVITE